MKIEIKTNLKPDKAIINKFLEIKENLHQKKGKGSEYTGWLNLPSTVDKNKNEIKKIKKTAVFLRNNTNFIVVIGIGGSYLGAKAVIEALSPAFIKNKGPQILFAGNNLDQDYIYDLLQFLDDKNYGIVVISKSGTTIEPAISFRLLEQHLIKKEGKNAKNKIVTITDKEKGALLQISKQKGYKTFVIPDDIGGRFSVLTAVGLLPIAIAGFDIDKLLKGAQNIANQTAEKNNIDIAMEYAMQRYLLYNQSKTIELMVSFNLSLNYFGEWWKQLFGESEGKENKGVFPAYANFTTDLHSLGQYIQEGSRILFETIISVKEKNNTLIIPAINEDIDNLNYLAGKEIDFVNKQAEEGTIKAHIKGNVPVIKITIDKINESNLGELIFFFEKACAYSAYAIEVNPFNQPGVEEYKKQMKMLLVKA